MNIKIIRSQKDLSEVLMDEISSGSDTAYVVLSELNSPEWENITILTAGKYGREYIKTYGHYHSEDSPVEKYKILAGEGILVLQEKTTVKEEVGQITLVNLKQGEETLIPNNLGHCLVNVGNMPLITADDRKAPHPQSDYQPVKDLKGLAVYLTDNNGSLEIIKNPNYRNVQEPIVLSASEFANRQR